MSDIKLFKINGTVSELEGKSVALERSLQILLEKNLETFLGVRFLASEHSTGHIHRVGSTPWALTKMVVR